ncbi:uncharacterized protein [Diadema antillarum]|uniref:uncharacterized protein n=1 Tax=Diadema antillarum TaxID=105358 RepID=UPI003A8BE197
MLKSKNTGCGLTDDAKATNSAELMDQLVSVIPTIAVPVLDEFEATPPVHPKPCQATSSCQQQVLSSQPLQSSTTTPTQPTPTHKPPTSMTSTRKSPSEPTLHEIQVELLNTKRELLSVEKQDLEVRREELNILKDIRTLLNNLVSQED